MNIHTVRRHAGRREESRLPRVAAFAIFASLLGLLQGCGQVAPTQNTAGYFEITASGITLQWKVTGTDLDVIVSAPTIGWIGVGFDPSSRMKDANFILAKVESGTAVVRDDFGVALILHQSDESLGGSNDVANLSGTETAGETRMSYAIPLDSGDPFDRPLVPGTTYKVLLSYSSSDRFDQKHAVRTSVTITL